MVGQKNYTYREFILFILDNIASAAASVNATQIDIVIDFYHAMSIKAGTRLERGSSSRVMFSLDDAVPGNLTDLLKNNDFKNYLNSSFSQLEILEEWSWQWDYCVTNGKFVMERIDGIQSKRILCMQPTNTSLEEADNRIVLHIRDAIILRDKHEVLVRTVDSDVIIILLGFFPQLLQYNEDVMLSVDYGTGNFRRFININNCYQYIGESNALALQFFHRSSTKRVKLCSLIDGCTHQNMKTSQKHFKNLAGFLRNKPSRNAFQSSISSWKVHLAEVMEEILMNSDLQLSKHHLVIIFASCRHLEEDWSFMCVGLHIRLVGSGAMLYPKSQHQNFLNLVGQLLMVSPIFFGQQMVQKRVLLMKSQKPASAKFHHQA